MRIVERAVDLKDLSSRTTISATELAEQIPELGLLARATSDRPDIVLCRAGRELCDEDLREAGRAVSRAVGRLLVQDAQGAIERDVLDRGTVNGPVRYSASNVEAPMHTDGMHMPDQVVPDYFSLTCIHPAAAGGELSFLHLSDVLASFADPARSTSVLSRDYWFHTKAVDPLGRESVRRPILKKGTDDACEIQYAREYIDLGHNLPQAPSLDNVQREVLKELDDILKRTELQHHRRLARGDVVVIDNRHVLHARTAFEDSPSQSRRCMMRLWISRAIAAAVPR